VARNETNAMYHRVGEPNEGGPRWFLLTTTRRISPSSQGRPLAAGGVRAIDRGHGTERRGRRHLGPGLSERLLAESGESKRASALLDQVFDLEELVECLARSRRGRVYVTVNGLNAPSDRFRASTRVLGAMPERTVPYFGHDHS
jgi:hypothetical protein